MKKPIHYSCAYGTSIANLNTLIDAYPYSVYCCDKSGFTPLHYAMANCEQEESPGAVDTLLVAMGHCKTTNFKKHPLDVLAERTKKFKDVSIKGCDNAQKCLTLYLRRKPDASTNFFTALQSLPQWLEDKGEFRNNRNMQIKVVEVES